jgi:hypothetical protein
MADDIDLLGAIYDTIIDPSGWDGVVRGIVQATNSGGRRLDSWPGRHMCPRYATSILFMSMRTFKLIPK